MIFSQVMKGVFSCFHYLSVPQSLRRNIPLHCSPKTHRGRPRLHRGLRRLLWPEGRQTLSALEQLCSVKEECERTAAHKNKVKDQGGYIVFF